MQLITVTILSAATLSEPHQKNKKGTISSTMVYASIVNYFQCGDHSLLSFLVGKILLLVLIHMPDPSEGELQIFLYRLLLGGWGKLLSQTSA
jgi:hypothetical protein